MTTRDPDDPALDDAALLLRARSGDRAAQGLLIGRYADDVYRLTARLLNDSDLARDAAQDTFINVLHGLNGFHGRSSIRTWILRIAANTATSVGRRQTRRREMPIEAADHAMAPGVDTGDDVAARIDAAKMQKLLAQLPPKQRMAVVLRIQEGLSYAEIGEVIDCSEGSARVNYHIGIKRLRELAAQ